ncbi:MAG: hypothetical protein Q7T48_05130 [Cellvibrio sp.]|uniref:hypothetical protein n=1 Tax=Cellvibrio sp. TaxID=1965322 RepID=UPI00271BADC7|nr:hypothetical protein [Cellvibrio sp.]
MKTITRVIITVACLFAAIGCYAFGVPVGGVVFLLAGLIFEGMFWFGIFGKWKMENGKWKMENGKWKK